MSATDELRRLLDERGVRWDEYEFNDTEYTHWTNDDGLWCAASADGPSKLHINILYTTPEQAITATFGGETCHIERYDADPHGVFVGSPIVDDDGNETTIAAVYGYRCSKCGGKFMPDWSYCPNCGRRVVG